MFRGMFQAVARKFASAKRPSQAKFPPVAPCPEIDGNSSPGNAAAQDGSPRLPEDEISFAQLIGNWPAEDAAIPGPIRSEPESTLLPPGRNGNGKPDKATLLDRSQSVPESAIASPQVNGNGEPGNVAIPERAQSVPETEIQLRAYLKWEAAGKPKGQQARFWLAAKEELLQGAERASSEQERAPKKA